MSLSGGLHTFDVSPVTWNSEILNPTLATLNIAELGEFEAKNWINGLVEAIRAVKADSQSLRLQNEFYERSKKPLETPQ